MRFPLSKPRLPYLADGITANGRSANIILSCSAANIKATFGDNGRAEPAGGVRQARPAVTGVVGHRRIMCNLITMTIPTSRWPYSHEPETATLARTLRRPRLRGRRYRCRALCTPSMGVSSWGANPLQEISIDELLAKDKVGTVKFRLKEVWSKSASPRTETPYKAQPEDE